MLENVELLCLKLFIAFCAILMTGLFIFDKRVHSFVVASAVCYATVLGVYWLLGWLDQFLFNPALVNVN